MGSPFDFLQDWRKGGEGFQERQEHEQELQHRSDRRRRNRAGSDPGSRQGSQAAARKFNFKLNLTDYDFGGERYLKTGEVLPASASDELRKFDAILLGAIGHPDVKPGILEKGILLKLRFELDQYINLRPVKLYPGVECPLKDKGPEDIDYVVVRENPATSTPASAASR